MASSPPTDQRNGNHPTSNGSAYQAVPEISQGTENGRISKKNLHNHLVGQTSVENGDALEKQDSEVLNKRDARLKQRIRVVKVFLRILSFLLAAYTLTTMSLTLSMFLRTVRIRRTLYIPPEPITRGPWAKNSKIWPTYVLLVTSIISCGSSLIVLVLYTHSIKAANKAQLRYSQIAYGLFAAYAAVWIGTAVAYRQGKNGKDMWGWSCEGETQRVLQPFFKDKLDFRLLCDIQTSSWAVSVVQAIVVGLNFIYYWSAYRRFRVQEQLYEREPDNEQKQEQKTLMETALPAWLYKRRS